jgi:hypothetical protein
MRRIRGILLAVTALALCPAASAAVKWKTRHYPADRFQVDFLSGKVKKTATNQDKAAVDHSTVYTQEGDHWVYQVGVALAKRSPDFGKFVQGSFTFFKSRKPSATRRWRCPAAKAVSCAERDAA